MITIGLYGIPDTSLYGDIPVYTHDHSIAVMERGRVRAYLALERYTRKKYDNSLPRNIDHILGYIINKYKIDTSNLRIVSVNSFVGSGIISYDGNFRIEPSEEIVLSDKIIFRAKGFYYNKGVFASKRKNEIQAFIIPHEIAHIGAILPFTGKFEDNSLLVHIDGGAFDSNISIWYYKDGQIEHLYHSWAFKEVRRFHANHLVHEILGSKEDYFKGSYLSIPGKLMGYASYGTYKEDIANFLRKYDYFDDLWNRKLNFFKLLEKELDIKLTQFDNRKKIFMDIAAILQKDFERAVLNIIEEYKNKTGADYLYYSGGGALNIHTNIKIVESDLFKKVFIPPCTNDSGLSIGAAALLEYLDYGKIEKHSPFLNNLFIENYQSPDETIELPSTIIHEVCDDIVKGYVIGICIGYGEIGPRALGHRSIIGRPDKYDIAKRISIQIKKREWYRPLAVSMLLALAKKVAVEDIVRSDLWKFMLGAYHIKNDYVDKFRGVIHVDGTVRIHAITENDKELKFLYDILYTLYNKYKIFGIINTSFNIKGEPILHWCNENCLRDYGKKIGLDGILIRGKYIKLS